MKKSKKFLVAGIVIIAAIGALIYMGIKESGVYYMTIAELKSKGTAAEGQGLRLSGNVIEGSIEENNQELLLRFKVKDEGAGDDQFVNVYYKGVKPDSFKADVQVILEGKYESSKNQFKATTLLVKCPSRYEGEVPPEEHDYSYGKDKEKRLDDNAGEKVAPVEAPAASKEEAAEAAQGEPAAAEKSTPEKSVAGEAPLAN